MKIKMTAWLCLLSLLCSLLTGCGGSSSVETEAPTTESAVTTEPTTEPTTMPTEPKTFFEEQGFTFWEDFEVYEAFDEAGNLVGGIVAKASIPDSTECKIKITSGNQTRNQYVLADTIVNVITDEYTLVKFADECKESVWSSDNLKDVSDNLYEAFRKEDGSLTKEVWLEQYLDYKVIHCQLTRRVRISQEVSNIKKEMNVGQNQWRGNWNTIYWFAGIMNNVDGSVYETVISDYPGVAEQFSINTETGTETMTVVADVTTSWKSVGSAQDFLMVENFFIMVPREVCDLSVVLCLVENERTLEEFETDSNSYDAKSKIPWQEKTYDDFMENIGHTKSYFLSLNYD